MDQELIYKTFFETIEGSLDWANEAKDTYPMFIEGVWMMACNLLDNIKNTDEQSECSCLAEKVYAYAGCLD